MFEFIQSIGNTVITVIQYFIDIMNSFVNVLRHIPEYMTFVSSAISFLPDVVVPFALTTIVLSFIYFVIGRMN